MDLSKVPGVPSQLLERLQAAGLTRVSHILSYTDDAPPKGITSSQLLDAQDCIISQLSARRIKPVALTRLATGINSLDVSFRGGLPCASITQFASLNSSGATQLLLTVLASTLIQGYSAVLVLGGCCASASAYKPRLHEIIRAQLSFNVHVNADSDIDAMLSRVLHLRAPANPSGVAEVARALANDFDALRGAGVYAPANMWDDADAIRILDKTRLIAIDGAYSAASATAGLRRDDGWGLPYVACELGAALRMLARASKAVVAVTNGAEKEKGLTMEDEDHREENIDKEEMEREGARPAMGRAWACVPDATVLMERMCGNWCDAECGGFGCGGIRANLSSKHTGSTAILLRVGGEGVVDT